MIDEIINQIIFLVGLKGTLTSLRLDALIFNESHIKEAT
jgi:hypothetical protein